MAIVTTSSNLRDWNVNPNNHTTEEIIDYITNFTVDDINRLTIVFEDNMVAINGLPITVPGMRNQTQATYNDTLVWAYEYFRDREKVEIQYLTHPLDVPMQNSLVDASEFTDFIAETVSSWKVKLLETLEAPAIQA